MKKEKVINALRMQTKNLRADYTVNRVNISIMSLQLSSNFKVPRVVELINAYL